jgi:hypothetical protein
VKYEPPEAFLSTGTIAKPFLTFDLILLYAEIKLSSIFFSNSFDFSNSVFSSFSVSFSISPNSEFLFFKCDLRSLIFSFNSARTVFLFSIVSLYWLIFFSDNFISSSWNSCSFTIALYSLLFLTFFKSASYFYDCSLKL